MTRAKQLKLSASKTKKGKAALAAVEVESEAAALAATKTTAAVRIKKAKSRKGRKALLAADKATCAPSKAKQRRKRTAKASATWGGTDLADTLEAKPWTPGTDAAKPSKKGRKRKAESAAPESAPKAKAKARAKAKASAAKAVKADGLEPEREVMGKATFAKRYRPSDRRPNHQFKYDWISSVYNTELRSKLTGHVKMEACCDLFVFRS